MGRTKKRGAATRHKETGEVWAKVVSSRSKYFISRSDPGDECRIDDEAEFEIVATIDAITPKQRKHLGEDIAVSLLAAAKYESNVAAAADFFGSLNLRASQRSALAYMPSAPFWALPAMIHGREAWVSIGWAVMKRGHAHITSVFIGDEEDRKELLALSGNALLTRA